MTLAARDHGFVAATADYFLDQYDADYVDSGIMAPRKVRHLANNAVTELVISNDALVGSYSKPNGVQVYTRAPYFAGAMVAATLAFSPAAYASETRPRPPKVDAFCLSEAENCVQLRVAEARVDYLAGKVEGWKGPDSVSMPNSVKEAALDFIRCYFSECVMVEPFIGLDADGDVTLFWKNEVLSMDLSITQDGTYSFYAETKDGACYRDDEVSSNAPLPDELKALLKKHVA
uniref:Uncharacterized protein n=1 Tax=Agrobacterium albertimagni TaxID=147266 RepID=A0A7C1T780_9HYPH